jgi:MoaA/NifB/PqqE/SkfB family radical SAM enzyme
MSTATSDPLYVLYRGPLSSCNYDCGYCPFAKHVSSREELRADEEALRRFVEWATDPAARGPGADKLGVLFTPWGEALVRRWYREALVALSHDDDVERVAIQTNLTGPLDWLADADADTLALWVTYHPSQIEYDRFLSRVHRLHDMGVRHSVGVVGLSEHLPLARRLRSDLAEDVYLWINAYKSEGPGYYGAGEVEAFSAIDPLFALNNVRHASRGEPCRTGARAITVDGDGDVRRCHFTRAASGPGDDVLGNLYRQPLSSMLRERPCPVATCGCHIGYVHLDRLGLYDVFGDGVLERVPHHRSVAPPRALRVLA